MQVELDEGPRLTSHIVGAGDRKIQIGQRVEVVFADIDEELEAAKADADAAQERYEQLRARALEMRSELQGKIAALKPSPTLRKGGTRQP